MNRPGRSPRGRLGTAADRHDLPLRGVGAARSEDADEISGEQRLGTVPGVDDPGDPGDGERFDPRVATRDERLYSQPYGLRMREVATIDALGGDGIEQRHERGIIRGAESDGLDRGDERCV